MNHAPSNEAARNVVLPPPRRHALLLDHESSARRQLAHELGAQGFEVAANDDADAGVSLASRLKPSLVVLELRLRSGSGLELIEKLRSELPEAKIVVLTSYGSVATAVRALRLGATNYLCKPASAIEVLWAANEPHADQIEMQASAADSLTLDQAIWEYIHQTIEMAGSLSEAARRLGVWRQSLKRMIAKYRPGDAPAAALRVAAGGGATLRR